LKLEPWAAALFFAAAALAQSNAAEARKVFQKASKARGEEARRGFERAVALDPRLADAWHALGRLHAAQARFAEARRSFEKAIQADPGYPDPYVSLAVLQHAASEWKALAATTERVLHIDRYGWPATWFLHATAAYNLKRLDAAETSARQAIRLDPGRKNPRAAWLLGEILLARGDRAGAAGQFRDFLKAAPLDAEAEAVRTKLAGLDEASPATFRVTTDLTLVRFQVTPDRQKLLTDLRPDDIEVREDGVAQKVALFEGGRFHPRTVPLEITLLFDCSGSVRLAGRLDPYVFHATLLDEFENVSIGISGFSDHLVRLTRPTRDRRRLKEAMDGVLAVPSGGTALFRAIVRTARETAETEGGVRLLVVLSDGLAEPRSDATLAGQARRAAKETGVAIYPVLLPPNFGNFAARGIPQAELETVRDFLSLAAATGGQTFTEMASDDLLPRVLRGIASQIRYEYVVGYYPTPSGTPAAHRVEVAWRSAPHGQIVGGTRVTVH
jgi:VWFA-related protein